jgi:hypothetical protein
MHYSVICFPANAISALATMQQDKKYHRTQDPTYLIGASMGALRSLAIIQSNLHPSQDYTDYLSHFMINLTYHLGDTPSILTHQLETLYDTLLPEDSLQAILDHPNLHLAIMVTQLKYPFDQLPHFLITLLLIIYLLLGIYTPFSLTSYLFESVCFYSGNKPPPIEATHIKFVALTTDSLRSVLKASAHLPFITKNSPITRLPGYFLDGGITNFMCNFKLHPNHPQSLTIIPDQTQENFPTYLDSFSKKTKPLIAPYIPSLLEWFYPAYIRDPEKRKAKWRAVYLATPSLA